MDAYGNPTTYDEYAARVKESGCRYEIQRIQGDVVKVRVWDGDQEITLPHTTYSPVGMDSIWSFIRDAKAQQARTRLNVAAPELLEALKRMVRQKLGTCEYDALNPSFCRTGVHDACATCAAVLAIAKAEGGSR